MIVCTRCEKEKSSDPKIVATAAAYLDTGIARLTASKS